MLPAFIDLLVTRCNASLNNLNKYISTFVFFLNDNWIFNMERSKLLHCIMLLQTLLTSNKTNNESWGVKHTQQMAANCKDIEWQKFAYCLCMYFDTRIFELFSIANDRCLWCFQCTPFNFTDAFWISTQANKLFRNSNVSSSSPSLLFSSFCFSIVCNSIEAQQYTVQVISAVIPLSSTYPCIPPWQCIPYTINRTDNISMFSVCRMGSHAMMSNLFSMEMRVCSMNLRRKFSREINDIETVTTMNSHKFSSFYGYKSVSIFLRMYSVCVFVSWFRRVGKKGR